MLHESPSHSERYQVILDGTKFQAVERDSMRFHLIFRSSKRTKITLFKRDSKIFPNFVNDSKTSLKIQRIAIRL